MNMIKIVTNGIFFLFLLFVTQVKASNYVKIAVIGHKPPAFDIEMEPEKIVGKMIEFWHEQFAQVLPDRPDLIVVPEACDRPAGFPWEKAQKYYKVRKDQIKNYFASVAKENHCYIIYSALREMDDGSWRNSSIMIDRNGQVIGIYNKNHLTIGEMNHGVRCGTKTPIIECDFGRVAMLICFDLNFNELRLEYVKEKPDLLIFSSMYHGGLMQSYWAYSCRAFFIGAVTAHPSAIYDPLGEFVAATTNYYDFVVTTVNLDCRLAHLDFNWRKLKAMKEKYGCDVTIKDPGFLGAVLISSEHETISADDMIKEFQIEVLDDYFQRSLNYRHKSGNM